LRSVTTKLGAARMVRSGSFGFLSMMSTVRSSTTFTLVTLVRYCEDWNWM
jgi:hypothetical protein